MAIIDDFRVNPTADQAPSDPVVTMGRQLLEMQAAEQAYMDEAVAFEKEHGGELALAAEAACEGDTAAYAKLVAAFGTDRTAEILERERFGDHLNAIRDRFLFEEVATSLAGIIMQLEEVRRSSEDFELAPHYFDTVLAGLRIIAAAGDPVAAAPVTGDCRILGLFREWSSAFRYAESIVDQASEEVFEEALEKANRLEDAIIETPAEGIVGLAIKTFYLYRESFRFAQPGGDPCALNAPKGSDYVDPVNAQTAVSAIRDIARLVPELAPLCAPALAGDAQP
jgi:hypothetical protein